MRVIMIYLDFQSTTPLDDRVLRKMLPYFSKIYANPSSAHEFGRSTERDVEFARAQLAKAIGANAHEIIFTSGATESNHLVFHSLSDLLISLKKTHIIVSAIEHKSILDLAKQFSKKGFSLSVLPVNRLGFVDPDTFKKSVSENTGLVSIMAANNEIGTIQPIQEIAELCAKRDLIFHTDAAQALGRIPFDVSKTKCLFASLASHKIYGPKGVGALYVRGNAAKMGLNPMFIGGSQENGMRSGTLNVPGIIGFAEAASLSINESAKDNKKAKSQIDRLLKTLIERVDGIAINGDLENRLPNNLNLSFKGVDSDALITSLPDLALSNGSACSSRAMTVSHVLKAIGITDEEARSSVRFGVGRTTTDEDIDVAAERIIEQVNRIRLRTETALELCETSGGAFQKSW